MQDLRQTEEWGRFLQSTGWVVKKINDTYCFIKKIPLTPFSIMKVQRFFGGLDLNKFNKLKKDFGVVYSILEPISTIGKEKGLKKIEPYLPTRTIVIDLKRDKKELWKDLSENARRILKKENGIVIKKVRGERFLREWKKANKTWSWELSKLKKLIRAFDNKAEMLISKRGNKWFSGILILKSEDTAFYFQTWTNEEGRILKSHYKLVWETILSCKKDGYSFFDFEGIEDTRTPRKTWTGFSEFKKKFGGKEINFLGCFGKWW
jgi:hypothetical protein